MKAAIRHILADEHGIFCFKATAQEGNQVAVACGADDSCFIQEGLLRTERAICPRDKLFYGNNCPILKNTSVHFAKRSFSQQTFLRPLVCCSFQLTIPDIANRNKQDQCLSMQTSKSKKECKNDSGSRRCYHVPLENIISQLNHIPEKCDSKS